MSDASVVSPRSSAAGFVVLVGAIIIQLILGTVYGYSIFWQPLNEEIFPPIVTQAEVDAGAVTPAPDAVIVADAAARDALVTAHRGDLAYAFSICVLAFALVMIFAGRLQDRTGPRIPAIIGAALMGVGFLIAGLVHGGNSGFQVTVLWMTIGLLAGAGIGFTYVCPIAALVKWFPRHKGLVSGLAVAGFGFGAFIFKGKSIGALGYIDAHGIRPFFLVHAAICFVGICIGALLLRNPPTLATAAARAEPDSSWKQTLRSPAFYTLWLMYFSSSMAGLMVIGIVKVFAGEQLVSAAGGESIPHDQLADLLARGAAAVGWLAIFNAVGRVVWGFVSDRIGRTRTFIAMFVLQAITMFVLGKLNTELALAVGASLVGFNYGGSFALFPSATADMFGAKNLGANYGWLFTSYGIAGVVGIAAGNTARTMTGSYEAAFAIAGVLCLISAGLALLLVPMAKKQKARLTLAPA